MNKSYGLIMSVPMVLAYLADKKTQTRRTKGLNKINQNPDDWQFNGIVNFTDGPAAVFSHENNPGGLAVKLPYGFTGQDTLYFKETYQLENDKKYIYYKADTAFEIQKWCSSMFMPRAYSRFQNIPILNVRVERLQAITEQEAKDEGVTTLPPKGFIHSASYRSEYFNLWDTLNAKRGHPASKNEWVFVYEFPPYSAIRG
jgi:hypothetical protein